MAEYLKSKSYNLKFKILDRFYPSYPNSGFIIRGDNVVATIDSSGLHTLAAVNNEKDEKKVIKAIKELRKWAKDRWNLLHDFTKHIKLSDYTSEVEVAGMAPVINTYPLPRAITSISGLSLISDGLREDGVIVTKNKIARFGPKAIITFPTDRKSTGYVRVVGGEGAKEMYDRLKSEAKHVKVFKG